MTSFIFFLTFTFVKNIYEFLMFSKWIETQNFALKLSILSFQNDLKIAFFIFLITYILTKLKHFIGSIISWLIVIITSILLFLDLQTIYFFNRKLVLLDIFRFSDIGVDSYYVISYATTLFYLLLFSFSLTFLYVHFKSKKSDISISILLLLLLFFPIRLDYLKAEYLSNNFVQNNMAFTYTNQYSDSKKLTQQFHKNHIQKKGLNRQPNIIIILAESWSAIDSNITSNVNLNHLNEFDKITHEGKIFTNFFAEGSTTDQAYVSLFTGLPPLLYNSQNHSYLPFYNTQNNLIQSLNHNNYYTDFIKAHSLNFLGLRDFLKELHFNKAVGKEEAFSQGEKYTMGGVADEVVYNYALQEIKTLQKPFFIALTTLSTHIPYYSPKGWGENNSYKYSSEEFQKFYYKLKKSGYLKNNYLLLLGDHRKMTPLDKGEYKRYKTSAYSRVVCALWGGDTQANSVDNNYYNQTDITHSIRHLISQKSSLPKLYNDIFTQEINRDFVIHDSFENRSEILIFNNKNKISKIKVDGDNTQIIEGEKNKKVLNYINEIRGYYQERVKNKLY